MKTLKEHVILYDEVCPMCNLYTKAFISTKMLDKDGRATYQNLPDNFKGIVNLKRAVNEIALINRNTGEVTYGVHSILKILLQRFSFLKVVFQYSPFSWLASKAYRFVSYNRRVIMPPSQTQQAEHEPSFHKRYRVLYLIFTWFVSAVILNVYSKMLFPLLPTSNLERELLVCGGQILWQGAIVYVIKRKKAWDYLGNLMSISFAGAILLCIGLLMNSLFPNYNTYCAAGFFMLVVGLMFLEHIRRTRLLQLTWVLTCSWVLYRCFVLFFIL